MGARVVRGRLERLERWLDRFGRRCAGSDPSVRRNIALKRRHSTRVRAEAAWLCRRLRLDGARTAAVQAAALLHDTGRFVQYARFKTFLDRASVDHAALGVELLRTEGVLREWGEETRSEERRVGEECKSRLSPYH